MEDTFLLLPELRQGDDYDAKENLISDEGMKAERARIGKLMADVADKQPLDQARHLITNDVEDADIVAVAGLEQSAIDAARSAFAHWAGTEAKYRAEYIELIADKMRERRFELAAWMVYESGKPWAEADADVAEALVARGAGAVIAGCTEIPLVLDQDAVSVPLISSTDALAEITVQLATGEQRDVIGREEIRGHVHRVQIDLPRLIPGLQRNAALGVILLKRYLRRVRNCGHIG